MTKRWVSRLDAERALRAGAVALALGLAGGSTPAEASGPSVPIAAYDAWKEANSREKDGEPREFVLINYFFTRLTVTNQVADPTGLRGVALGPIGALGGSAVGVNSERQAYYIEQRWIPIIEYSPYFVDGLASFRAQFEVDYLWGRAANAVQPNEGGGFNADEVNIQTKNVNVSIYPTRNPNELSLLIGTQSVYDSYFDPARTPLNDIIRTGYKLAFLGTDATGLSVFSGYKGHSRLSLIPMQTSQPDKAAEGDPRLKYALLAMADYAYPVAPGTNVGVSAWFLRDDTKGTAYAYEGLVTSGPSSTGLGSFTGVPRFSIERPSGSVFWLGANFHHNIDFRAGRFGASGFVMYNGGGYESGNENTLLNREVDISGVSANLELLYNFGRTSGDLVTLEGMFTTGDSDLTDGKYTGAFTLNQYGLPGAVWFNHKMLLLFPFTATANNYTGAVTDISNQGYGLRAVMGTASYDLVPHKLNLKVGAGFATAGVNPPDATPGVGRGRVIGTEINAELKYHIRYLMTLGFHAGYMFRGDFYDGVATVTADPWAAFTTFTWYAF